MQKPALPLNLRSLCAVPSLTLLASATIALAHAVLLAYQQLCHSLSAQDVSDSVSLA